ncbi:MAG TPA: PQQ-dependent sugar dehydrogenase [Capillimicrobium sp.]
MRALALLCSLFGALGISACGAASEDASAAVKLVRVGGDFASPLLVTAPRGERKRVYVVEQGGTIRVVRNGRTLDRPFLDLRGEITAGGEQGLLGLAFAPDFAKSKRFYVHYSAQGSGDTRIVEYRAASGDRAREGSARVVLRQAQPEPNHNGGQIAFGPDGLLYIGLGDGGGADDQHGRRGNAQDLGSLLGKLLRIDPRKSGKRAYTVPKDNPFVGRAGARGEIYSYGLRNPWRFSFDREDGSLSIADVGQNDVEEVDFVARGEGRGANFGWRPFEGSRQNFDEPAPGHVPPVIEKSHADGWCSITGGFVVRDPALTDLVGRYIYGDFCKGQIRSARLTPGGAQGDAPVEGLDTVGELSSFGEDGRGRIYAVSLSGPVYRLVAG